ncbi:hypothetical protein CAEBREN_14705 [Caenorhabditis brenneri]|uniref:Uncharacterized protein n=1 Tax=Caenorhabditis brenneri TaxID=135651 RepID=G0PJ49_CAEBE|nr:hypothetical protein CAEBREN_14705 [Caenorhabditis brenneri]
MAPFRPPTQFERTKCWRWMYHKFKTSLKDGMTVESIITSYLEEKRIKKWSSEEFINFFQSEMIFMLPGEEELTKMEITVIRKGLAKLENIKEKTKEISDATTDQYEEEEEVISESSTTTSPIALNQLTPLSRSLVDAISKRTSETHTSSDDESTDKSQFDTCDPPELAVKTSPSLSKIEK